MEGSKNRRNSARQDANHPRIKNSERNIRFGIRKIILI
jgi:hypothetical protein